MSSPFVGWFTGLPCSGKTTLARSAVHELRRMGLPVELLDGDELRELTGSTGFLPAEREAHLRPWAVTASLLERNGIVALCSFVSPYRSTRRFARELCRNFFEIHVSTPLEVCEARDVKGMYERARAGEIQNFTGVNDRYEEPECAELALDTSTGDLSSCTKLLLEAFAAKGFI